MKKTILLMLTSVLLASCGGSKGGDDEMTEYGYTSSNQFQGGACGSTVVHDYNMMIIDCGYLYSRESINECIGMIKGFQAKYSGINCSAIVEENYVETTVWITDSRVQSILEEAENL